MKNEITINMELLYNCFLMRSCFYGVKSNIYDDIKIVCRYEKKLFIVTLQSDTKPEEELERVFWIFYDYLDIILGYFPIINNATFADGERLANMVEKYKTKQCFFRNYGQFVKSLSSIDVEKSFSKYIEFREKASFPISMYSISKMENNPYSEVSIVNALQSLDGMYDKFSATQRNILIADKDTMREVKERIKNIDLKDIIENYDILSKVNKQIKECITRLEYVNYDTKLRFLFKDLNNKYELFKLESSQKDVNKNFDKFIQKCKQTRNKLSHSSETKNCFNGVEAEIYTFKIILSIRLLIIEEIGLAGNVDKKTLTQEIESIDERIVEELYNK